MINFILAYTLLVWRAFVASFFWMWFAVPAFPSLPVLSWPHMIGLILVWGIAFVRFPREDEPAATTQYLITLHIATGLIWGIGWLFSLVLPI